METECEASREVRFGLGLRILYLVLGASRHVGCVFLVSVAYCPVD